MKNFVRESNIELLRIIAAFGVVVLHFNLLGGIDNTTGASKTLLIFLESITICSVNIFLIIFGYFSSKKFSVLLTKPIKLLLQVSFVKVVFYILFSLILTSRNFSVLGLIVSFIPNNYFIVFYIAIYLLSPFLNKLMSILNNECKKTFLLICFILISLYPFIIDCFNHITSYWGKNIYDLSTISREGALNGYTLANFVLMYIIGCYMSYSRNVIKNIKKRQALFTFFVSTLIIFIFTFINIEDAFVPGLSLSYGNPLVIIQSISIVIIQLNLKFKNSKYINALSKASLMCYLMHVQIIGYFTDKEILSKLNFIGLSTYIIFITVIIYLLSYIVMILFSFCLKNVNMFIDKYLSLEISAN